MDGGGKRNQLSQMSSSREQRQISSGRIELPMIIGPQHRLHLEMETLSEGVKNH
jgi:hypothetical protein